MIATIEVVDGLGAAAAIRPVTPETLRHVYLKAVRRVQSSRLRQGYGGQAGFRVKASKKRRVPWIKDAVHYV